MSIVRSEQNRVAWSVGLVGIDGDDDIGRCYKLVQHFFDNSRIELWHVTESDEDCASLRAGFDTNSDRGSHTLFVVIIEHGANGFDRLRDFVCVTACYDDYLYLTLPKRTDD